MSNSQNRARVRAQSTDYPTRPETAATGWSAAASIGVLERAADGGPQTDHLAALVRRARRREARRRLFRAWLPRRRPTLLGVPSESSVKTAVQAGLTVALPEQPVNRTGVEVPVGASSALRHAALAQHPAGGRLPEQRGQLVSSRES